MTQSKALTEAILYFSDDQTCINAVAAIRWSNGKPVCPRCITAEGDRKHYWLETQKRWTCYSCGNQFSIKVGSIFEDSALGLDKWMIAIWMLVNCRNGVSSYEVARATGMGHRAAWFVLQRLRHTLNITYNPKVDGTIQIEVEEYIRGEPKKLSGEPLHEKASIQCNRLTIEAHSRESLNTRSQIPSTKKKLDRLLGEPCAFTYALTQVLSASPAMVRASNKAAKDQPFSGYTRFLAPP